MHVTASRNASLHSIARDHLPKGATATEIANAVKELAKANGLSPTAQLTLGQKLVLPDSFAAVAKTDTTSTDALARLSTASNARTSPLQTRMAAMLDLKPAFNDTVRVASGEVKLPAIAGVPVKGTISDVQGMKTMLSADALRTVDASLGKLTREQFDAVHKELGGRSGVKFDAQRDYSVVDFLPPAVQALVNKDLEIPRPVTLKGTKMIGAMEGEDPENLSDKSVDLTMNCHATAWEAARAYQGASTDVSIFYGEMITADGLIDDGPDFKRLGTFDAAKKDELLKLDLKPGDIVQFNEVADLQRMTMLLHSAVYVGGGLFFEKPNTEGPEQEDRATYTSQEETPFRLATLDLMSKPIDAAVEGHYSVEVFRPQTPMKPAEEAFASSLEGDLREFAKKKGKTLGNVELVAMFEQGMMGNIRAEHASALVKVGLKTNADGTASLEK